MTVNEKGNAEPHAVAGRWCVVLGAGEYYGCERDALATIRQPGGRNAANGGLLVIAADGGLDHASALGLTPDYVIGDFDSAAGGAPADAVLPAATTGGGSGTARSDVSASAAAFPAGGAPALPRTIALPAQKDDTDMVSAVKAAWSLGARRFLIGGGLGGRLDHTLGNLAELALVSRSGGAAWLIGDGVLATAVTDGVVSLPGGVAVGEPWVGVASLADSSRGVLIEGLKYVYAGGMSNVSAFTSNEYVGTAARVGVESGTLIVTYPLALGPDARVTRVTETSTLGDLSTAVSSRLAF